MLLTTLTIAAHPIHLHLVNFEIVIDFVFTYQTDGEQVIEMANGKTGVAPRIKSVTWNALKGRGYEYYDESPKDVVTVKPGNPDLQIGHGTIIRATFPKPGQYVWHCHILR